MAIITRCKRVSRASYRIWWFSLVVVLSTLILCYYFCYCPSLLVAPAKEKITGSTVQDSIFPKEPSSPPAVWCSKKNHLFFAGKYTQVLTSSCSVLLTILLSSNQIWSRFLFCKTGLVMQVRLVYTSEIPSVRQDNLRIEINCYFNSVLSLFFFFLNSLSILWCYPYLCAFLSQRNSSG